MSDLDITFSRTLLAATMEGVRPVTTVVERKAAWVYGLGRDQWEFHGPDGFYWHGRAGNAYDARAKGWDAWLAHRNSVQDCDNTV